MANKDRMQANLSKETGETIRQRLPRYHWGAFAGYLLDKYLSEDEIQEFYLQWGVNNERN